jgi:hypothetical protein
MQAEVACIWALVDTERPTVDRKFWMFGTGHPIDERDVELDALYFIDTVQLLGGTLVFHVFEEI